MNDLNVDDTVAFEDHDLPDSIFRFQRILSRTSRIHGSAVIKISHSVDVELRSIRLSQSIEISLLNGFT